MKAIVVLGAGQLEIRDFPDPEPGPDDVVIQIKASGICGTDLHHLNGPRRSSDQIFIEGHEPCGVVAEVGRDVRPAQARIGDRVMVHHYDGCRACDYCRSGWTQLCPHEKVIFGGATGHGSHAEYMKVPAHTLVKLPDTLSYKAGAAIACGTGTAYGALKRISLTGDQTIAIFGQGAVGFSCTLFAKSFGARVIALDIVPSRLETARTLGADHVLNPFDEDPVAAVRALTREGEGVDAAIECSANALARRQAVEVVKRRGTACMVGAYGSMEISMEQLIQLQKTVVGSLTFSKNMQAECARYIAEREIDLDALYTHEFHIDQAAEAYAMFAQGLVGKGAFVF